MHRAPIQRLVAWYQYPTKCSRCRCLRCTSCLLDDRGYYIRPRHVDRVTARNLVDRRARALGHETLARRRNHLVLGYEQVPARLGFPKISDGSFEFFRLNDRNGCERKRIPQESENV